MPAEAPSYALLAALAIALLAAAVTDIRSRRIANRLTGGIALAAPLFWWASGMAPWPGIAIQIGLALLVFTVLAALFAARAMGGGDVKLLTALALWIEPAMFLKLALATALLGGLLTIALLIRQAAMRTQGRLAIPYGVAIASAGLWVIASDYLHLGGLA